MMTTDEHYDELDYLDRSFLEDLIPSIKTYTVSSESQFLNLVNSQAKVTHSNTIFTILDEFLLFRFSDTDIHSFDSILNPENPDISFHISSIDLTGRLLLMRMPGIPHGSAAGVFSDILAYATASMGLRHTLKTYIGSRIWGEAQKRAKEPDYGWAPVRRAPGQPDRPTIALEVAYSEADKKLQSDVRFWLSPKDGNANVCLTVRILRSSIRVEQWHRDDHGRICRKGVACVKKTKDGFLVDDTYPIRISFKDLYNREADCPRERDIDVTPEDLKVLARTVWDDHQV